MKLKGNILCHCTRDLSYDRWLRVFTTFIGKFFGSINDRFFPDFSATTVVLSSNKIQGLIFIPAIGRRNILHRKLKYCRKRATAEEISSFFLDVKKERVCALFLRKFPAEMTSIWQIG